MLSKGSRVDVVFWQGKNLRGLGEQLSSVNLRNLVTGVSSDVCLSELRCCLKVAFSLSV